MIPLCAASGISTVYANTELYSKLTEIFTLNTDYQETLAAIDSLQNTSLPPESVSGSYYFMYLQPGLAAYSSSYDSKYRFSEGGILTFCHSTADNTITPSPEEAAKISYILDKLSNSFDITFDRFGHRSDVNIATTIRFKGNVKRQGIYMECEGSNAKQIFKYDWSDSSKAFVKSTPSMRSGTSVITLTSGSLYEYHIESDIASILPAAVEIINSAFVAR